MNDKKALLSESPNLCEAEAINFSSFSYIPQPSFVYSTEDLTWNHPDLCMLRQVLGKLSHRLKTLRMADILVGSQDVSSVERMPNESSGKRELNEEGSDAHDDAKKQKVHGYDILPSLFTPSLASFSFLTQRSMRYCYMINLL